MMNHKKRKKKQERNPIFICKLSRNFHSMNKFDKSFSKIIHFFFQFEIFLYFNDFVIFIKKYFI